MLSLFFSVGIDSTDASIANALPVKIELLIISCGSLSKAIPKIGSYESISSETIFPEIKAGGTPGPGTVS